MKKYLCVLFASVLFFLLNTHFISAQNPREEEVRKIDNEEREAVLKMDTVALFTRYWAPTMVVNTPVNRTGDVQGTKAHVRAGELNYSVFDRMIEKITVDGDVAMVMGAEIVKPQGNAKNSGKTVSRRFTNIWKFSDGKWMLIGRQATIIKVE